MQHTIYIVYAYKNGIIGGKNKENPLTGRSDQLKACTKIKLENLISAPTEIRLLLRRFVALFSNEKSSVE